MDLDFSQGNSVFMPGMSRRGPVFNSPFTLGALPTLTPPIKYGLMAAILAAAALKKISYPVAGIGAAAVYLLFPDAPAAAATLTTPAPDATVDLASQIMQTAVLPAMVPIAQ
jgi:hypothetical protein